MSLLLQAISSNELLGLHGELDKMVPWRCSRCFLLGRCAVRSFWPVTVGGPLTVG